MGDQLLEDSRYMEGKVIVETLKFTEQPFTQVSLVPFLPRLELTPCSPLGIIQ